jgi:hypothetical protein
VVAEPTIGRARHGAHQGESHRLKTEKLETLSSPYVGRRSRILLVTEARKHRKDLIVLPCFCASVAPLLGMLMKTLSTRRSLVILKHRISALAQAAVFVFFAAPARAETVSFQEMTRSINGLFQKSRRHSRRKHKDPYKLPSSAT